MNKQEVKVCDLCKLGIDESKQFAEFIHYVNKDKVLRQCFYHVECFRDKLLGSAKGAYLMSRANKLLTKAEELIP
jgi:hypothetical protein